MIQRRAGRRGLRRSNHHPMRRAQRVPRRARGEPRARSVRVIHGPCAGSLVLTSQQVVTSPRGRLMSGRRAVAAVAMTLAMALVRGSTRIMFRRDRRDVSTTDGMATGMGTRRPRRQRLVGAPWAASYLMRERRSEAIRGHQRQSEAIRGNQRRSEAIRGNQRQSEAIRGNQRQSETLIRGTQRQSEAIRGDQRRSEAIRGHQRPSEAIRGHQRPSEAIRGNQRQSEILIRGTQRRSSEAIVPSCTCRRIPRYSDRDHALPIGVPAPARRCPAAPSAAALTSARACRTV